MLHGRFTPRVRRWAAALLINFTVSMILPIPHSACSAPNTGQLRQPQQLSESKPKCRPLGFTIYAKWEKPAGLFPFYREDCKLGYVDNQGRVLIAPQFDQAGSFYEGIAAVGIDINGKLQYGFINLAGRFVIDPEFDRAGQFSDGVAGVTLSGKSGYSNTSTVSVRERFL